MGFWGFGVSMCDIWLLLYSLLTVVVNANLVQHLKRDETFFALASITISCPIRRS